MNQHSFIPYFQTTRYRVETMIGLAEVKRGEKAVDLGSGDGRILIALAKAGAIVTGYELDPVLVTKSKELIEKEGLEEKITILQNDFWSVDLSEFDIITIYPMPDIMESLERKLQTEAKNGARILLNYYPFTSWKEVVMKDKVYLYRKSL